MRYKVSYRLHLRPALLRTKYKLKKKTDFKQLRPLCCSLWQIKQGRMQSLEACTYYLRQDHAASG